MIAVAVLLQVAQMASGPAPTPDPDIIVSGKTTAEAKRILEACIADRCTPDKEIKASLVYATRQMLDGDYPAARQTLLNARHRNAAFDKTYPLQVSDLHRALTRLSTLDGWRDSARLSAVDATDALRAGLPSGDPTILSQRLFSASQLAREGRIIGATQIYNDVADKARQRGQYAVEAQALFDGAVLYATLASLDPVYRNSAQEWADRITHRTEPEFVEMRSGLSLLRTKLAALAAKPQDRAAIYSAAQPADGNAAILLDEPKLQVLPDDQQLAGGMAREGVPEWADVGFWVRPDGSVADLAVVRQSEARPGSWLGEKLKAVSGRRYAPLQGSVGARGLYRVERYSLVHVVQSTIGTHMPVRARIGEIDTMDMTPLYRS
ncbi:hypothetical protein [Sphingomonas sp. NIC1]|uniref:hypothetical protein n=1 Tax=Sphingomonas sp. NIC1 TaxID=1961362 RepID=UPI001CF66227|nr:hypothetical protein [Sphingomonas sp. NIC1]